MTSRRHAFLVKLIRTLVEEWSYDEVQKVLAELSDVRKGASAAGGFREGEPRRVSLNRERARSRRPTAVEQVTRYVGPNADRETLFAIAAKFDRKEFLPRIGDIKEFLAMMGEAVGGMKHRLDGFRQLLPPLAQLPSDKLKHLATSTRHSGPAQLGPLSDAIKSTGEARRRSTMPEPEQKS